MRRLDQWKETVRPYYLRWCYFPLFPQARPEYFRDGWNVPHAPFDAASLAPYRPEPGRTTFLFLPMNDWHARTQRSQHLAAALAARRHCSFYLNPHVGREYESVFPSRRSPRIGRLLPRVFELHIPLPLEPVYHHRMLQAEESYSLAGAMAPLDPLCRGNVVQIVSLPTWLDAALILRRRYGWPIVYDCHDLLAGFETMSADIVQAETRLLAQADHVVFTSKYLRDMMSRPVPGIEARSSIVRNGVDWNLFGGLLEARRPRRGPERTIGYFGALEKWFDCDMVRAVARRAPRYRIELLGRVESPEVSQLAREFPNVRLEGEVPYDRLPARLAEFDVAVIPFRNTPLTRCADPIKLYEYFAAGLPVAATWLPELAGQADLIYLARDAGSFADGVIEAAAEDSVERRLLRAIVASQSSWEARAAEFERLALRVQGRTVVQ